MANSSAFRNKTLQEDEHVEAMSLWQLLIRTSNPAAEKKKVEGQASKMTNMRDLVNAHQTHTSVMTLRNTHVCKFFEDRLLVFMALESASLRVKLLRWEIMKIQMLYGLHEDGTIVDSGEGRVIRIPLKVVTADSSAESLQFKVGLMNHSEAQREFSAMWKDLTVTHGPVTKRLYFALVKSLASGLFVHLKEADIFRLVCLDHPIDVPFGDGMSQLDFFRFITSMVMVWAETRSASEVLLFLQTLHRRWMATASLDLTFLSRFSTGPAAMLASNALVPNVPTSAIASEQALAQYTRECIMKGAQHRFDAHIELPVQSTSPKRAPQTVVVRQRRTSIAMLPSINAVNDILTGMALVPRSEPTRVAQATDGGWNDVDSVGPDDGALPSPKSLESSVARRRKSSVASSHLSFMARKRRQSQQATAPPSVGGSSGQLTPRAASVQSGSHMSLTSPSPVLPRSLSQLGARSELSMCQSTYTAVKPSDRPAHVDRYQLTPSALLQTQKTTPTSMSAFQNKHIRVLKHKPPPQFTPSRSW